MIRSILDYDYDEGSTRRISTDTQWFHGRPNMTTHLQIPDEAQSILRDTIKRLQSYSNLVPLPEDESACKGVPMLCLNNDNMNSIINSESEENDSPLHEVLSSNHHSPVYSNNSHTIRKYPGYSPATQDDNHPIRSSPDSPQIRRSSTCITGTEDDDHPIEHCPTIFNGNSPTSSSLRYCPPTHDPVISPLPTHDPIRSPSTDHNTNPPITNSPMSCCDATNDTYLYPNTNTSHLIVNGANESGYKYNNDVSWTTTASSDQQCHVTSCSDHVPNSDHECVLTSDHELTPDHDVLTPDLSDHECASIPDHVSSSDHNDSDPIMLAFNNISINTSSNSDDLTPEDSNQPHNDDDDVIPLSKPTVNTSVPPATTNSSTVLTKNDDRSKESLLIGDKHSNQDMSTTRTKPIGNKSNRRAVTIAAVFRGAPVPESRYKPTNEDSINTVVPSPTPPTPIHTDQKGSNVKCLTPLEITTSTPIRKTGMVTPTSGGVCLPQATTTHSPVIEEVCLATPSSLLCSLDHSLTQELKTYQSHLDKIKAVLNTDEEEKMVNIELEERRNDIDLSIESHLKHLVDRSWFEFNLKKVGEVDNEACKAFLKKIELKTVKSEIQSLQMLSNVYI